MSVAAALAWAPDVCSAHIGVTAKNGVVTLSGHVERFAQKMAAERSASQVKGVRAIAQEIEIRALSQHKTDDEAIADKALRMLSWNKMLPTDRLVITVEHGWVTLSGEMDWQYQRAMAERDVLRLNGVTGMTNQIKLSKQVQSADVKHQGGGRAETQCHDRGGRHNGHVGGPHHHAERPCAVVA